MSQINALKIGNLRNDAHFQFHSEVKALIAKFGAKKLNVEALFKQFEADYGAEDAALKKIAASYLTAQIQEADKTRDNLYKGMVAMSNAHLKHCDPATTEAARKLNILFKTYGDVAGKTLNEQTSAVHNLLQELNGKYAAAVNAITGLRGWVDALAAKHEAFDALVKERFEESASKSNVPAMKDARAALDATYRAIAERIHAQIVMDGPAKFEPFISAVNAVVNKYAATTKAKGKDKKDKKDNKDKGDDDEQ